MPQNLKQLKFTGSNYGSGGTSVPKVVLTAQTPTATTAVGAPIIQTSSVTVPAVPASLVPTSTAGGAYDTGHIGCDAFFVNRNSFWLTLVVTMVNGTSGTNASFYYPIPPSGVMFVPRAVSAYVSLVGGNPYNTLLTAPIGGLYPVTIDQVVEY